jgi:dienelactone hydrolase
MSWLSRMMAAAWVCVAVSPTVAQERWSTQIPTSFVEDGKPVTLELVYQKPPGQGPFPTLVFTHGSTNNGNDPREVTYTVTYPDLAAFFNERGWMVVFLQRRGRGKSGGTYAEGWDPTLGRYACDLEIAGSSLRRALADLEAVHEVLAKDLRVDGTRILVGGNSRGGLLSLAHAANHPDRYIGVVNFVGGWAGRRCNLMQEINGRSFASAGRFPRPTLWLYGERDAYYSVEQSKSFFDTFTAAGGKGSFHVLTYGPLRNDHLIVRSRALWEEHLSNYLGQLGGSK